MSRSLAPVPRKIDELKFAEGPGVFVTTHWSLVLAAGKGSSFQAEAALEKLCQMYWYPVYAYIRRRGFSEHDAKDLTQDFFARLLKKQAISRADRERGKFRAFLLSSAKNFLANEWDRSQTARRGGGQQFVSLSGPEGEGIYRLEPSDNRTPDRVFERAWATTLLNTVLGRVRDEFAAAGRLELFEQLKVFVWGEKQAQTQAELAGQMKLTEGALQVKIHRFRRRFRELLRVEIAQIVSCPEQIDGEISDLMTALRE